MTEFPVVARDTLHVRRHGAHAAAVGVRHRRRRRLHAVRAPAARARCRARLVPFAALGISLFCWDFAVGCRIRRARIATAGAALSSFAGWRMIVDLFLLAACGGVFSVPLYAIIQDAAAPSERSRMIAANNIMNALFMVAGAAAAAALAALGLRRAGGPAHRRRGQSARRAVDRPHPAAGGLSRAAALVFRPPSRRAGARAGELQGRRRPRGHRRQPPVLSRCLPDRCLRAGQPDLRDPHVAGREVVFQAVPRRGRDLSGGRPVALFGEAHGRGGARPRAQADDLPRGPHDAAPAR